MVFTCVNEASQVAGEDPVRPARTSQGARPSESAWENGAVLPEVGEFIKVTALKCVWFRRLATEYLLRSTT